MHRRLWRIDRAGSLDRLRLCDESISGLAAGEVTLRVHAVGLNFADAFACQGLDSATPTGPFMPGRECAGVVEAVGRACVQRGDVVLVQSAAGGVGLQALAILERIGAVAIVVVGSESKRGFLRTARSLEVPRIVVRRRADYVAQLDAALAAAGSARGFDVVFDAVLGPWFEPAFAQLAPEGRYVLYGAADFMTPAARPNWLALGWRWLRRPRLDPLATIPANRALLAFNLI